jgi:hypothetical protein
MALGRCGVKEEGRKDFCAGRDIRLFGHMVVECVDIRQLRRCAKARSQPVYRSGWPAIATFQPHGCSKMGNSTVFTISRSQCTS